MPRPYRTGVRSGKVRPGGPSNRPRCAFVVCTYACTGACTGACTSAHHGNSDMLSPMGTGAGIVDGRVALVTGASSGIGAGIAKMLAAEGARVALAARRRDELESVAKEIGSSAVPIVTDLSDVDAINALVEQTMQQLGAVDVLVNNA